MNYPQDADGDALRRVAATSDMTREMDVDFVVVLPSQEDAGRFCAAIVARGYDPSLEPEEARWTCWCTRRMVLTYESVVAAQKELNELSAPFGGRADGWGTSGNGP